MFRKENIPLYKRRTIFALIILLTALLQNGTWQPLGSFPLRFMPLLPLIICIGMFEKDTVGAAMGLFGGALWDVFSPSADGFNTLFLFLAGAVCGVLIKYLLRNNLVTATLISAAFIFLRNLLYWLFFVLPHGFTGAMKMLWLFYIPSSFLGLAIMPLFYFLLRKIMKNFRQTDIIV